MKRVFDDSKYVAAHGKAPKGHGNWWFMCGGVEYAAPSFLSLTEAKKAVLRYIKDDGIADYFRVYILP